MGDEIESYELKNNFRKLGVSHIFVASGGNLVIFTSLFSLFLKNLKIFSRKIIDLLVITFIIFYLILVGFEGSILRASFLALLLVFIKNFSGRIPLIRNLLVFSLFILVLVSPNFLFDIGTMLSFFSFLGIVYLDPFLNKEIFRYLKHEYLSSLISQPLSVFLFIFPLTNLLFNEINFYGLIFNLIFILFIFF